ncbi:hypothetical protein NH8B_2681 [Pseudogulbenkiania sp. NH8B]|uniref:hypothetical protein n=1 Tax=Pseudogulbenkiania sp. (strain NH8B) TaxID=748280 RepID=UPI0002279A6B|nr:hypothetical protein [Pseudogulbenkiania sp. NH8B]BAK77480.1 hypothetical protein NH8B_2681 [Pseudogulbenkiania sp. NH8B]
MASENLQPVNNNSSSAGNWWEGYIIRYALGSLVGAVICWKLINDIDKKIPVKDFIQTKDDITRYVVLLLMGLCYCYVASSPMLVLHVSRYRPLGSLYKNLPKLLILKALALWGCVISLLLWLSGYFYAEHDSSQWLYFFIGLIVPLLVYLVQIVIVPKNDDDVIELFRFYDELSFLRHYTFTDIMTSYRHIREHGNAYSVLILEILLGWSLVFSIKVEFYLAVAVLIAWILPGAFVWIVGTNIEKRYIKEHLPAAKKKHSYLILEKKRQSADRLDYFSFKKRKNLK